jgi:multidrug resistance efflux pump
MTPSTPASPASEQSWLAQPANRFQILTYLTPLVIAFVWFLIRGYFADLDHAKGIAEMQAAQKATAEAQVSRSERLAVIEAAQKQQGEDLKEIKADVKDILKRLPQSGGH